ncbi:phosphoribosylaminoimidazolesuccinocarboxamide synthase [Kiloniella sp.]|uniref:phosphoribosylaminoimidazolesuccinocarboxamide synthase n=1 Tax=Kiloniella sp. TaxID=1938587 RepID=UPI003A90FA7D
MGDKNRDFQQALVNRLTDATYPELPKHYQGKVRDAYDLPDGRRIMIATDRQSAFDRILAAVPHKGQVLNQTARFWFEQTEDICPNHVISFPDPNVVIGRNLEMLPIEMVVRDYMTGSTETSIWPMYQRGERTLYGHNFPEGLKKNQKLPTTIITPTTKAAQGDHDAPITAAQIVDQGILSKDVWDELARLSLALFARGREVAAKNGLILVDTKYEFGVDQDGRITLADEIHTPDSSRYWIAESYQERMDSGLEPESLDKEFLRLWVSQRCDPYKDDIPEIPDDTLEIFSEKYINLFERVTGEAFKRESFDKPLRERIRDNLAKILPEYF